MDRNSYAESSTPFPEGAAEWNFNDFVVRDSSLVGRTSNSRGRDSSFVRPDSSFVDRDSSSGGS